MLLRMLLGSCALAVFLASAPRIPSDAIKVTIEMQRQVFHANEPIAVRVQLVNVTRVPQAVWFNAPWHDYQLIITRREDGKVLSHAEPWTSGPKMPARGWIAPGEARVYAWGAPGDYTPIVNWGYSATLPPGHYTVQAVPLGAIGGAAAPHDAVLVSRESSNAASFTVLP